MERVAPDVLLEPIRGVGLEGEMLADEIGSETTLFVFLRHLG